MARAVVFVAFALAAAAAVAVAGPQAGGPFTTEADLGEAFFHDVNLSAGRSQSCATCHDAQAAFTDPRETAFGRAVSLGDDGHSLGNRNTPSIAYAARTPAFHIGADGLARGGQFWDGRAADLAAQAGGPPLNPAEMAMIDRPAVAARLAENPAYVAAIAQLFGPDTLSDPDAAFAALTRSLAAYEMTPLFQPFDSRYDRSLRKEVTLTRQEELGRTLFFSNQFTNCRLCHQSGTDPLDPGETFTNATFHNIGVPANPLLRQPPDAGLGDVLDDPAQRGRFKVPSLRNVAVTGPYMHNGVFADLRSVVAFYNKYNAKSPKSRIDPETGRPWAPPEIDENLSMTELETGPALDDRRIDAIVAFLRTLTDRRYEPLLKAAAPDRP